MPCGCRQSQPPFLEGRLCNLACGISLEPPQLPERRNQNLIYADIEVSVGQLNRQRGVAGRLRLPLCWLSTAEQYFSIMMSWHAVGHRLAELFMPLQAFPEPQSFTWAEGFGRAFDGWWFDGCAWLAARLAFVSRHLRQLSKFLFEPSSRLICWWPPWWTVKHFALHIIRLGIGIGSKWAEIFWAPKIECNL